MKLIRNLYNRIKSKHSENDFIKNSIITLMLRSIGALTLFGFSFFIAKKYDAEIVGQYDFVRVVLLVMGSISMLGTDHSILYFSGKLNSLKSASELKPMYYKILRLILSSSILFFVFFILIPKKWINSFFEDNETYLLLFKCFAILFFNSLTLFNTEMIRALDRVYLSELFRNTFKFFPVFIGAFSLVYWGNPNWLVDFYIFGFIILGLITTFFVLKELKKLNGKSQLNIGSLEILKTSYPMAINSLCIFLMLTVDILLLKKHFGNNFVAYYSLSIKLMTIMSMVTLSINITISPKIASFYQANDKENLQKILSQSSKIIFTINLLVGLVLIIFGKQILGFFGAEYQQAYLSLLILSVFQIICSFFGSAPVVLNMTGQQKVFQKILISALAVNIIFNLLLIPYYGLTGAAISFGTSLLLWNLVVVVYFYKKEKISLAFH